MSLTADRETPLKAGDLIGHPVKGGVKIFANSIVCLDAAGWAVPGATATTLKAVGRGESQVDNVGGADGDKTVIVRRKAAFRFKNAASDPISRVHIGATAYVVDDETVAATNGANTRSAAGRIIDLDAAGVWVEFI